MTWLRHASRHVHATVVDYLTTALGDLHWTGPAGEVPFGLPSIAIITTRPFIGTKLDNSIGPNTVCITLGNELHPTLEELGGPLSSQEYPIFCDVFMSGESAALALATDIRDILLARLPNTKTALDVIDQVTGDAVPDWKIYLDDVDRNAPEHTFPLSWQTVRVTASTYFPEVVY